MTSSLKHYQEFIIDHFGLFLLSVALLSFGVNHYLSKKVLLIALSKRLFAKQTTRSSHHIKTPSFGGVSIFIVIMITLLLAIGSGFDNAIGFTLTSCFILFLTGLKDDLIETSAKTKLYAQILAAFLFVVNPDFALGHLSGFFGINLINANWTYFLGVVFIVSLVNSFNLIDGIDGLSGMSAIVSFSIFGVYFYINDHYIYTIFCATLIGALASFLTYNFAKPGRKMFLGDTGALVIGFLLAVLALRIIEIHPIKAFIGFYPLNAPLFIIAVLIIPILDTIRIIFIRLSKSQKPWHADRAHIHHVLLDLGLSHKQATAILISMQLLAITGFTFFNSLGNIAVHGYLIALYLSYAVLFFHLKNKIGAAD